MKHIYTFIGSVSALTALAFSPQAAIAQSERTPASPTDYSPTSGIAESAGLPTTSAVDYALDIGRALLSALGLIALVLIIYSGFMLLTSQGESDKVKKGRDTLLWSIVGIVVILSSLGILTFIDNALFGS